MLANDSAGEDIMGDTRDGLTEQELDFVDSAQSGSNFKQEVSEIKDAVSEVVSETSLADKVDELRTFIENISEDVQSWPKSRVETYIESLETLKSQVDDIQSEWNTVSTGVKTQQDRLESLLESFPGIIETSTLRALSLRMTHLEKLVSNLVGESNAKTWSSGARKQMVISLVALGVTVILWTLWIVLSFIR